MNVGSAIKRFEKRSRTLVWQAWALLANALILMAFGGWVVYSASSLTARDIGTQDFDKRLEQAQAEVAKLTKEQTALEEALVPERVKCAQAYAQLFSRWPVQQSASRLTTINFSSEQLPDGDEIARQINLELRKSEAWGLVSLIGMQLNIGSCSPPINLVLPKERFGEITESLAGREPEFDRKRLSAEGYNYSETIPAAIRFQESVMSTIYNAKVQAAAAGNTAGPPSRTGESNDLLLRLIQTSITRPSIPWNWTYERDSCGQ
jgi:hypothetical protein